MSGYFFDGRPGRDLSAARRRNAGGDSFLIFPDARLAAWALLVGRPDLARLDPPAPRHRGELEDVDFSAAVTVTRPSLLRRLLRRLIGAATAPASAPAGSDAWAIGESGEKSYIGSVGPAPGRAARASKRAA